MRETLSYVLYMDFPLCSKQSHKMGTIIPFLQETTVREVIYHAPPTPNYINSGARIQSRQPKLLPLQRLDIGRSGLGKGYKRIPKLLACVTD